MNVIGTDAGYNLKSIIGSSISLAIAAFLMAKYMPACFGSGVPRTKILLAVNHGVIHIKEWVTKIFTTVFTLAAGVPLGSEGPTIFISSGVGSSLGRWFKLPEKMVKSLVYAGCSAGIAAAFNTPIAAVIFTMEEVIGTSNSKAFGPILISSLIASITAATLIGQNSIFTPVHYSLNNVYELFFYVALGVLAGFVGPFFIKIIIRVKHYARKVFKQQRIFPIIISFAILIIFSQYDSRVIGNGLSIINQLLQGNIGQYEALIILLLLKFIVCAFCYGTEMSGGILMPVLFIGAALGAVFGNISTTLLDLQPIEIGAYALVGMGAFFASVIKTPFTSIILVFEMTRDYRLILPLMLTNLIAYLISERISKNSIYEQIATFEGYELPVHEEDFFTHTTIEDIYVRLESVETKKIEYRELAYPDHSISYAVTKLRRFGPNQSLKVVERLNATKVIGVISMKDIIEFLEKPEKN
jgi:CIC family chloride channel protein